MEPTDKKTSVVPLVILVIVALLLVWVLNKSLSKTEQPFDYEMPEMNQETVGETEVEEIQTVNTSSDISALEEDLSFDVDTAMRPEELQ